MRNLTNLSERRRGGRHIHVALALIGMAGAAACTLGARTTETGGIDGGPNDRSISTGGSTAGEAGHAGGPTGQMGDASAGAAGSAGTGGGSVDPSSSSGMGGCRFQSDAGDPNDGGPYCHVCPRWLPPGEPDGGTPPAGPDGGDLTNGKPGCALVSCGTHAPQATTTDDRTLGFSATDVLDAVAGPGIADLTWYDGTSTVLRLSARYDALSVEVARPDAPDSGATPFASCGSLSAHGAIVTLSTDDGRLAGETFSASLYGETQPNHPPQYFPLFGSGIDLAMLRGSFNLPSSWGAIPGSAHLSVSGIAAKTQACSSYCTPEPSAPETAWSATESPCGYDGKIVAQFTVNTSMPGCGNAYATVATWRWR